jgi:hypothetical protein
MAERIHTAWSCIDTAWSGKWVPILRRKTLLPREISCICVGVAEAFVLLGCCVAQVGRLRLKCDGTREETRFCLSAKRTSPFKSARASVQSTTGSRGVRISGSNAGYTMLR